MAGPLRSTARLRACPSFAANNCSFEEQPQPYTLYTVQNTSYRKQRTPYFCLRCSAPVARLEVVGDFGALAACFFPFLLRHAPCQKKITAISGYHDSFPVGTRYQTHPSFSHSPVVMPLPRSSRQTVKSQSAYITEPPHIGRDYVNTNVRSNDPDQRTVCALYSVVLDEIVRIAHKSPETATLRSIETQSPPIWNEVLSRACRLRKLKITPKPERDSIITPLPLPCRP